MVMGNADTLMLSQYSDEAVAAVGVSNQILSLVIVMFGFVSTGTAILIAQHVGAKEESSAGKVAVVSLGANLLFGFVLSIVLFSSSSILMQMMNLPEDLFDTANVYVMIVGGFIFIQAIIMTLGAILRSYGYTKDSMKVTVGMNLLNIIGNYLFIFGPFGFPVLGVTGVAIATTGSRLLAMIVLFVIVYKRVKGELPFSYLLKKPVRELKQLLKIGIPSAGEHLAYSTSQMMITYFVVQMGTEALTTRVYTLNIIMFVFLFSVAIGQGTQILVGHYTGAGDKEKAYYRCMRSLKLAVIISTLMAAMVYLNSSYIFPFSQLMSPLFR